MLSGAKNQLGRRREFDGKVACPMSEAARKILEEALRLSAEERSQLAKQLLDSVAAANDAMEPEELAALDAAIEETYAE